MSMRNRLVEPLRQGAVPLRLINGAAAPNSGQHMVDRFLELMPKADVMSPERVGHWPQLEPLEAVSRAYQELIKHHGRACHADVAS
jgi:pimeloyl-ACP methyl ester carboxylesterase